MSITESSELIRELPTALLRWYPFRRGATVLYVGEAHDAMYCMLCDSKELKAETIHPDDLWTEASNTAKFKRPAKLTGRYEYVICIEALERSEDPVNGLKCLKSYLKKDGILLIGMNNRIGIRYFCGDKDKYTGGVFGGVENYSMNLTGVDDDFRGRTYARSELEEMLDGAGFTDRRFYSVLPDLQDPVFIFADGYIPNEDLSNRVFPAYNCTDTVFLNEASLYGTLLDNGLFHKLANAFLIECTGAGKGSDALHITSSLERGRRDALITAIHSDGTVTKEAAFSEGRERLADLIENSGKLERHGIRTVRATIEDGIYIMPFIEAENGQIYLKRLLKENEGAFLDALDHFRDLIMQSSEVYEGVYDSGIGAGKETALLLRECMFDMVPLNSFFTDGDFIFYDQEFCIKDYPVNVMLTRMIVTLYMSDQEMYKLMPMEKLFRRYGIWETRQHWHDMERSFLAGLRNQDALSGYHRARRADAATVNKNRLRMNFSAEDHHRIFEDIFNKADAGELIIFGSGAYARRFIEAYGELYTVSAVIDNDAERWGSAMPGLSGVKIQPPDFTAGLTQREYKIIICIRDYMPVIRQLEENGINKYSVFDPARNYPLTRQTS